MYVFKFFALWFSKNEGRLPSCLFRTLLYALLVVFITTRFYEPSLFVTPSKTGDGLFGQYFPKILSFQNNWASVFHSIK